MNAIQPSRPSLQPVAPRRVSPRTRRQPRTNPHQVVAAESAAKIAVNVVLSVVAVSALVHLLPYQQSSQDKLREIRSEVRSTEGRVNRLRGEFNRYFDPQQAESVLLEQSYRVNPTERQVVWLENNSPEPQESNERP